MKIGPKCGVTPAIAVMIILRMVKETPLNAVPIVNLAIDF